ncbi:acyltransferase family protein [Paenibacillus sp. GCM10012307]|uniref:Acyltransferase n=1 Tax=Paenibacillus roseus TaxID=2798579 RepID=A0A934MMC3_9BACL|nr:acyltransferase [Paenibacillus roseus]MBJ6359786.1 acyltransferase [Paenibacillus roseus]
MKRERLEIVQAYRAVVALLILISHVSIVMHKYTDQFQFFYKVDRSGGVDFFFSLSGFLIYYVYSAYLGKPEKIAGFLEKRFLRIYPLVWFFTLISLPVYWLFEDIGNGSEFGLNVIVSSLLLLPQQAPILGATWSLSHIVLFYLLFALYLWRPKLMKWVFALQLIGIVALYAVIDPGPSRNLFSLVFSHYNVNFIAGALCAHIVMKYGSRFGGSFITLGVLGYALNWWLHYSYSSPIPLEFIYLPASLCLLYGAAAFTKVKRLPPIINVLGDASYSIIVTNLPATILYSTVMNKLGLFDKLGFPLCIMLIIIFSVVTGVIAYFIIEQPLSAMSRKLYDKVKLKLQSRNGIGAGNHT